MRTRSHTLLLALSLAGCATDVVTPPEVAEDALLFGTEDWDVITRFETDPQYHVGALYARAVADVPGCSAWLISDDILVTAHHCGLRDDSPIRVRFGLYGESLEDDHGRGEADGRVALYRAGVPQAEAFGMRASSFQQFRCDFVSSDYPSQDRDVEYWRCRPNEVVYTTPPFDRERRVQILPGHVWGHYEVQLGERPDDSDLYLASVNNPHRASRDSVVLSPNGWVIDPDDSFSDFEHNFEYIGADNLCGSSGGPVIDERTHRAFGLQTGGYAITWDPDACDRTVHGNDWLTQQRFSNVGTYLGTSVRAFTERAPESMPLAAIGTHLSPWVGGTGGTLHDASCPPDFAALGIVYTSYSGHVGNFGVVCAPYRRFSDASGADQTIRVVWDQATVIAGGSIDTGFARATNADWNAYWHERLTAPDAYSTQSVLTCPPGSWLSGVRVASSRSVDRIYDIDCREMRRPYAAARTAVIQPITFGGIPAGGTQTDCGAESLVTGLRVRSGHWTDGMQLRCSQLFTPRVVFDTGTVVLDRAL